MAFSSIVILSRENYSKKGTVLIKDNYNGVTLPEIYFWYEIIQNGNVDIKSVESKNVVFLCS